MAAKTVQKKATPTAASTPKMNDLTPIKLTQAEFDALDAEGLRAKLCDEPQPRISRERGKAYLVRQVASGKINSIEPETMENWTYNSVRIKGVEVEGQGFTAANAAKTLTKAEFGKLDAQGKAALIEKFTHKRRAADVILPDLVTAGMPMSAEDVVHITCGRVSIEGVTPTARARKTSHAITEGVKFG